ncbi:MAG: PLDc N-terminal domain-containing protein [Verrucomicrobiales bacterium]|nr:PLDc N-terminal domain-containing protein [Verrucomicrobiales bacterium]
MVAGFTIIQWSQGLLFVLGLGLALWASGHALIYKRDPRSATLWVGVIWTLPLLGSLLYFLVGINRIRRWAGSLRGGMARFQADPSRSVCDPESLASLGYETSADLVQIARAVSMVATRPLLGGNRVEPLINGDEAYPAMLAAIGGARESITLATYIFDADDVGREFAAALGAAVRRGVEVRVLIDATGTRYSWPSILGVLKREGVRHARFLRTFPLVRLVAMNLRNHRKLLVIDGEAGFTGGMNLRAGHWLGRNPAHPVQDIHFRVGGPIVAQLQEVFVDDWQFTTGEALRGGRWFPELKPAGTVVARGIVDGPDEDFERLRWVLLSALAAARRSIRVATPYFLPDAGLIAGLNVAAMRGVAVDILLPERSNLPFVHWASRAHWWQVLGHGCRIWLGRPPFDHSKLFVVDDAWALVGSANWDPRSLRLNFEYSVECYDVDLAGRLATVFEERRARARRVTLDEVDRRSLATRLQDGAARLFTPFM